MMKWYYYYLSGESHHQSHHCLLVLIYSLIFFFNLSVTPCLFIFLWKLQYLLVCPFLPHLKETKLFSPCLLDFFLLDSSLLSLYLFLLYLLLLFLYLPMSTFSFLLFLKGAIKGSKTYCSPKVPNSFLA